MVTGSMTTTRIGWSIMTQCATCSAMSSYSRRAIGSLALTLPGKVETVGWLEPGTAWSVGPPVAKYQSLDLRLGQVPEKPLNVRVWESLVVLGQSFDEPTPRRQLVLLPWLVVVRVEEIVGRVAGDEEFGSQLVDVIFPSTDGSLEVGLRLADKLATLFNPSPSHLHGPESLIHGIAGVVLGIDEVDAAFVVQLEKIVLTIEVVVVLRDTPMGEYLVERGDGVSN